MQVKVISETIQEFNGERYYLCGSYFQRRGKRLHRAVWEYHNGPIPAGFHVHHVDGKTRNNQPENLALLEGRAHERSHMRQPERRKKSRELIRAAIAAAPEWHGSEAGKAWHGQHAREYWEHAPLQEYVCTYCGGRYQSRSVRHTGDTFCCPNHRAAYRRERLRNEGKVCSHGGAG